MRVTQRPSEKRFVFGETKYRLRKMVIIPSEIGGKKVMVKTEVVEEEDQDRDGQRSGLRE